MSLILAFGNARMIRDVSFSGNSRQSSGLPHFPLNFSLVRFEALEMVLGVGAKHIHFDGNALVRCVDCRRSGKVSPTNGNGKPVCRMRFLRLQAAFAFGEDLS